MARMLARFLMGSAALVAGTAVAQSPVDSGRHVQAVLTGAAEIPGPGDPDGSGTADVSVNPGQKRVCATLQLLNIAPATMAHIHVGPAGVAGGVAIQLTPPVSGTSSGCVDVPRSLALAILKNPAAYYVNVHNAEFPSGAIRGQLNK